MDKFIDEGSSDGSLIVIGIVLTICCISLVVDLWIMWSERLNKYGASARVPGFMKKRYLARCEIDDSKKAS